jgi:hypothetical protein
VVEDQREPVLGSGDPDLELPPIGGRHHLYVMAARHRAPPFCGSGRAVGARRPQAASLSVAWGRASRQGRRPLVEGGGRPVRRREPQRRELPGSRPGHSALEAGGADVLAEGRYDTNAMPVLAERYLQVLRRHKQLIWFERSGHSLCFEEPDRFNRFMLTRSWPRHGRRTPPGLGTALTLVWPASPRACVFAPPAVRRRTPTQRLNQHERVSRWSCLVAARGVEPRLDACRGVGPSPNPLPRAFTGTLPSLLPEASHTASSLGRGRSPAAAMPFGLLPARSMPGLTALLSGRLNKCRRLQGRQDAAR